MRARRRLVRSAIALSVLVVLFTVAALTILSLAAAGFGGERGPLVMAAAALELRQPVDREPQPRSTSWPPADFPSSDARQSDLSARRLLNTFTPLATVTRQPEWAGPFGGINNGVATADKVVALTFDDGPTPNTPNVIAELDSFDDHATFFWVGARITDDIALSAIEHGEELANHTWNHPNVALLNSAEASAEIGLCSARIAQITGHAPVWFRSPYNRLYAPELQQIHAHGLLYANYNVMSADWMDDMSEADVVGKVGATLKPGGIILMHDSPGHPTKGLHAVLQLLHDRGYRVVTLSELARLGGPVTSPVRLGAQGLDW